MAAFSLSRDGVRLSSRQMRIAAFAAVFALSAGAFAVESTGSLTGVVLDAASQNPIEGAVVVAHSTKLMGEQSAVTDETGAFEMSFLPPGSYGLLVKHDGFQNFSPDSLVLKGRRVKIRLALLATVAPPSRPAAPAETAVEFNDATMTAPSMLSGPNPEYTDEAVERGVEGTMTLRCIVDAQGRVHGCKVQKGLPFMDRAVIKALESRKYKPAMSQGKPVDVFYTFTLRLKLPQP